MKPDRNTPTDELPTAHCHNCKKDRPAYLRSVGDYDIWKCRECGIWLKCMECHGMKTTNHVCKSTLVSVPG